MTRRARNIVLASVAMGLVMLGLGIANPTALLSTASPHTALLHRTTTLAPPHAEPVAYEPSYTYPDVRAAAVSATHVYTGQPILLTLATSWPQAYVSAPGAKVTPVRPEVVETVGNSPHVVGNVIVSTDVVRFEPEQVTSKILNNQRNIDTGFWTLRYAGPGVHQLTLHLGHGTVRTIEVHVYPLPVRYRDVRYHGVSQTSVMTYGVDPSSARPSNWPWEYHVSIRTNYTLYHHTISRVTSKWSVPFIIHDNETGEIVETLTAPVPSSGQIVTPYFTSLPTQAVRPDYTATYDVSRTITVHGTIPVRFWQYWLGHYSRAVGWVWRPTLLIEWEWLVLAGLFSVLSLLGRFRRKNKGNMTSQTKTGGKAVL